MAKSLISSGELNTKDLWARCSNGAEGRLFATAFARELASLAASSIVAAGPKVELLPESESYPRSMPASFYESSETRRSSEIWMEHRRRAMVVSEPIRKTLSRFADGICSLPGETAGFGIDHFKRELAIGAPELAHIIDGLPALTTPTKMRIAEAISANPSFSFQIRSVMINSLSDSDKFSKGDTPARTENINQRFSELALARATSQAPKKTPAPKKSRRNPT